MRLLFNLIALHPRHSFLVHRQLLQFMQVVQELRPDLELIALVRPEQATPAGISRREVRKPLRHALDRTLWLNVGLRKHIRRTKADVVIHGDTSMVSSLRVPQWVIVDTLPGAGWPDAPLEGRSQSLRHTWKLAQHKAVGCWTTQPDAVTRWTVQQPLRVNWMHLLPPLALAPAALPSAPLALDHLFFLSIPLHPSDPDIIVLLKAFSKFLKRQQSGMYLVIDTGPFPPTPGLLAQLQTYKHRDQVRLVSLGNEADRQAQCREAYAVVNPSSFLPAVQPLTEAIQLGVPLITVHQAAAATIPTECMLIAEPSVDSLAHQLMWIYKQEDERNRLIRNATAWLNQFPAAEVGGEWVKFLLSHPATR